MINLRIAAFETNSSSSHSLSISNGVICKDDVKLLVNNGIVEICPGNFGWEEEKHNDPFTKASYCLTWVKNYAPAIVKWMYEYRLKKVIKNATGVDEVVFVPMHSHEDDFGKWGYIDHQSNDVCAAAFTSDNTLKQFIFCRHSVLVLDNDNH